MLPDPIFFLPLLQFKELETQCDDILRASTFPKLMYSVSVEVRVEKDTGKDHLEIKNNFLSGRERETTSA